MRFLFCLLAAASGASNNRPVVEIFLPPVTPSQLTLAFARAQSIVAAIYSEIGVSVVWRSTASRPSGCSKQPLHRKIVVELGYKTPVGMSADAFAYSKPHLTEGPCVTVLMDRLIPAARTNPQSSGFLLGHALAHEMGHVLEGIARHSETGLMQPRWSQGEIMNMSKHHLHFTAYDTELILEALGAPLPPAPAPTSPRHTTPQTHPIYTPAEPTR